MVVDRFDGVRDRAVRHLDTLGRAGRAGREDHVHQVLAADLGEFGRGLVGRRLGNGVVGQHDASARRLEHPGPPGRGNVHTGRDVTSSGTEHAEHRDYLVGSLRQGYADRVAGPHSIRPHHRGHLPCPPGQLTVGHRAVDTPDQRDPVGFRLGEREEPLVQRLSGIRSPGRVDLVANRALSCGQQPAHRRVPPGAVADQTVDQRRESAEHRVEHAGCERQFSRVPAEQQAAVVFGHLRVQPHLWSLRDHPHRAAEVLAHQRTEQLTEFQRAGENHRSEHLLALIGLGQLAQHLHAGERGVPGGLPQLTLDASGHFGERLVHAGAYAEQHRAGERADQLVDVIVQRFATEHRDVEQEIALGAPRAHHLGERRGEHHGWG